jgi:hypothetical protein
VAHHLSLSQELAQRKATLDGKTHTIVTTYHRRRQLKPHSTTVVLSFWAEQGAQDNFEFHAEFSLGVDPFEPTDPQYSSNVSQAVRSAFIEFLGQGLYMYVYSILLLI